MEGYIGEIRYFAATFAPRNWAYCDNSTLSIAQNTALFSILGTTYGGNGQTTFCLPDMRGRVAIGVGQSGGTSNYTEGELYGSNTVTMTNSNLPSHNHTVASAVIKLPADNSGSAPTSNPVGACFGPASTDDYNETATPGAHMAMMVTNLSAAPSGGGQPISIRQPYLGMNYVICLYGIFPSRN
jgi:microcystin-dependent protein